MIRICRFCGGNCGEKEPLGDKRPTHTECDVCHIYNTERIDLQKKLRKLSSGKLTLNSKSIEKISKRIDSINKVLAFRKYANENKGLKIRFVEEGKWI